ncbi:type VI secretion system Vgr family protein [Litchfieldella rifensis]|uniref:Type VI secretion system Vgr family protein n=1 Tax=Litchfieldella rifensis TaxID=762643 RepID=A0ABV7LSX8_9GAMM
MAHPRGWQFTLRLSGTDDLELAVMAFKHREHLSRPFKSSVKFASRDGELSPADWLDREACLTIWQDNEPLRRVHGIVAEFHHGDRGHRRTHYEVVIRPALWRLSLRHNSRIFQHVSPLTIINTLCAEHGIGDVAFAVTREPREREYCVQYRESDLAFVRRLAAEKGLAFHHEFDDTTHRLVFSDAPQSLPTLGERPYQARAGGMAATRCLRCLTRTARVRPSSATLQDYSFKQPDYRQRHEHHADGLEGHAQRADYEHYDYPGRYKADASGEAFTRIRLEHLRHDAEVATAVSDLPELRPGVRFDLTGHDRDDDNRDWQVVWATHEGSQPQAVAEDSIGIAAGDQADATRYTNRLTLLPGDRAWRPAPTSKPRVDGPQVAFVVGPEDEEIHCDAHGRVKCQFPWDRYAKGDDTSSAWLRVSQGWAGGAYGMMAIPRIGHEVIVSFLDGDPDQPLITGRTFHAVNPPPYALPEHKTRTVLRTQTHQGEGFNELRFEDEKDREQIWLHAQKDLELLTEHDRTEEIRRDSHLKVRHDRIGEIDHNEHLSVHGTRHTRVDGDDHLNVGATRHEKTGRAQLIEAGQEVHHQADSKTVVDAGAEITLQAGGSFLKLDPSGVTIVGASIRINSGGSPGTGSGQSVQATLLPGHAAPETHEAIAPLQHGQLLSAAMQGAAAVEVCQRMATGDSSSAAACALGEDCPCR